jgi:CO/xanthine dehydrogenase FAD-binding subunit
MTKTSLTMVILAFAMAAAAQTASLAGRVEHWQDHDDFAAAARHLERAVALAEEAGTLQVAARARISQADLAMRRRDRTAAEAAVAAGASAAEAGAVADEDTNPPDDLNGTVEYRRHLARVLVRRALEDAGA